MVLTLEVGLPELEQDAEVSGNLSCCVSGIACTRWSPNLLALEDSLPPKFTHR